MQGIVNMREIFKGSTSGNEFFTNGIAGFRITCLWPYFLIGTFNDSAAAGFTAGEWMGGIIAVYAFI